MIRHGGKAVGCVAFSRKERKIDFLAVAPEYRRQRVAARLLSTAMSEYPAGTELSVVTRREGDAAGEPARRLYRSFGFREGELLEAFGYPCQRLTGAVPASLLSLPFWETGQGIPTSG